MAEQIRSRASVLTIVLAFILIVVIGWFGYNTFFTQPASITPYKVLSVDDVSDGDLTEGVVNVSVESETPSLADLSMVALQVWKDQQVNWDQITVFFYLPGMSADDQAYAVADVDDEGVHDIHLVQQEETQPHSNSSP